MSGQPSGLEPVQHDTPALAGRSDENRQAADVVERQDRQPPVPATVLEDFGRSGRSSLEIRPGENHPFRVASRSRRVDDRMRRVDMGRVAPIGTSGSQLVQVKRWDAERRSVAVTQKERNGGVDNLMGGFPLVEAGIDRQ